MQNFYSMKKLLLLLLAILPFASFAQTDSSLFLLTENGFVSKQDTTKDYIVKNYQNIKKEKLYQKALIGVTKLYISPKDVISKVENETISINAIANNVFSGSTFYNSLYVDYTFQLSFKDGKIKFGPILLNSIYNAHVELQLKYIPVGFGGVSPSIYNKDGKVRRSLQKMYNQLSYYFNNLVTQFSLSINSNIKNDW